jgi:D-alanine-D-alanine ligase-like ATP-grasp enzyme
MRRPMRICVLTSSYERSSSAFRDHDALVHAAPHFPQDSVEVHGIHKATAAAQVRDLVRSGFDAFVNLCDGAWDEDRAGIEVVQTLERLGAVYTGADERFYDPTREAMKLACHYAGVTTPRFVMARGAGDVERAAAELRFPLIVKHPQSYGSIGLTRTSRVTSAGELAVEAARTIEAFGAALVEEFVEGREFTVLVAEPQEDGAAPRAWPPVEVEFPPGETFKHFDLKWIDFRGMRWHRVADADLAARLVDASQRTFRALHGVGYGRCDLRMDAEGRIHLLEINPNCAVFLPPGEFGSADEILVHDPAGPRGFAEHIVRCAQRRRERTRPAAEVRFDPRDGWGLHALRDLAAGDVVQRHEERPQHLVSRAHVERTWDATLRTWFAQYAWPLTDEVHVMWSERPEEWRPIDHACDPNAWLAGLDLVARRPIRRGERVTMDYATFCGSAMEPFACRCGAALCRGVVRGADHLAPFVAERYGEHVSDYVRRARSAAGA